MTLLANSRFRQLFIGVCTVLLFVLVYVYFVSPTQLEQEAAEDQLARKQEEYKLLQQASGEVKKEITKAGFELARIRQLVPEEPFTEQMLEDMRMMETVSGAKMNGYQFAVDQAAPEAKLHKVSMTAGIRGDYGQVLRLLHEIRVSPRLMTVDKLEVSIVEENADTIKKNVESPQVICQITIAAYYAPELAGFSSPSGPAMLPEPTEG
jgi:Tfp pilus assembly protein PilO